MTRRNEFAPEQGLGRLAEASEPRPAQRGEAERSRRRGFTLIEIMAVVIIMGLLAGIVGAAIFNQLAKARVSTTRSQLSQLEAALGFYQMDNARFPTTEQGLGALVERPTIGPEPRNYNPSGYLQKRQLPKDAWGNEFQYEYPGSRNPDGYDLWSLGEDGQPGGIEEAADIGNWAETDERAG